jgi:hypothetical protein
MEYNSFSSSRSSSVRLYVPSAASVSAQVRYSRYVSAALVFACADSARVIAQFQAEGETFSSRGWCEQRGRLAP